MTPLKLLYVDDEPDIREVAVLSLQLDPALEVRASRSGAEALSMLDRDAWRPDVILLDVMMPEMDGPATLSQMRSRAGLAVTPAIFITARAHPAERQGLLDRGAVGVITKPFDPLTLAQAVRAILAGA